MITAQQFSRVYEKVAQDQKDALLHSWPSQPRYTHYVKYEMMPAIAQAFGCTVELEYQRIDIIFRLLSTPGQPGNIVAAVEHENNFGGSHQEVTKLRDFEAPLGVMITFAGQHRRTGLLSEFDTLLDATKEQAPAQPSSEILVIFGPYGMAPPKELIWEYWVHRDGRFKRSYHDVVTD